MFKPLRMTRLIIGGHKDHLEPLLDLLHNDKILHLEDFADPTGQTDIGTPLPAGDFASEQLLRARGLLKSLDAEDISPKALATDEPDRILDDAEVEIVPVLDALGEARTELTTVESEMDVLRPFQAIDIELDTVASLQHVQVWLGTSRQDPRPAVRALGDKVETEVRQVGKQWGVVVAARKDDAPEVDQALTSVGFSAAAIPEDRTGTPADRLQELSEEAVQLRNHVEDLQEQVAGLRDEWGLRLRSLEGHLADEVDKTQAPLRFAVTDATFHAEGWLPRRDAERIGKKVSDAFEDRLYVDLLGDAPRGASSHGDHGDEDAHASGHDMAHGSDPKDEAPTALDNRGLAKPFEFLLGLLGRPRYHELDPTKLMLLFFPLFFGLMVGDVLVGLVIVLVGVFLKRNYIFGIGGKAVGRLLVMGGVMSIIIGAFVFGEALGIHFVVDDHGLEEGERSWEEIIYGKDAVLHGDAGFPTEGFIHKTGGHGDGGLDLHQTPPPPDQGSGIPPGPGATDDHGDEEHGGLLTPHSDTHLSMGGVVNLGYYSKIHDVQALLVWSIIIGIAHIVLGLVLGIRNIYVSHGFKLAVQEKVSWLLIMASVAGIALAVTQHWGDTILYGSAALLVVSTGLLWAGVQHTIGVGFIAILEIPSLFGNILSYTRLAAIGASKAGMAIAFSTIGFEMVGGAGGWIIYIASFALITVLAILAGSLQSLRLQFVEFFSKFYEGGGRPYLPFGRRGA